MEVLRTPPSPSGFVQLSEHQSQTPASYHDGPAILYHRSSACTLKLSPQDLSAATALNSLASAAKAKSNSHVNGHSSEETPVGEAREVDDSPTIEIPDVDIWVTSERLLVYSPSSAVGVSISYPSISLHAVQRPSPSSSTTPPALYLQLLPEAGATFDDHDPDETISLYIIPNAPDNITASAAPLDEEQEPTDSSDEVSSIYAALSACANLHPDPPLDGDDDDDDEGLSRGQRPGISFMAQAESGIDGLYSLGGGGEGGLPPPMPGSGGWITAENVGEFFDEDGNWMGREAEGAGRGLGEGAGRVRARDEEDGEEDPEGEEAKWTRTE